MKNLHEEQRGKSSSESHSWVLDQIYYSMLSIWAHHRQRTIYERNSKVALGNTATVPKGSFTLLLFPRVSTADGCVSAGR